MVKKFFLLAVFFIFIFLAAGCTIVRGTTGAVGGLATGAVQGSKEGFKEDSEFIDKADNCIDNWVKENRGFIGKADNWVKENLW